MSHDQPHFAKDGSCECMCRKCAYSDVIGESWCVCPRCDVVACGLHDIPASAPEERP